MERSLKDFAAGAVAVLVWLSAMSCFFRASPSHLALAESFRKDGKFEDAIKEYQAYIDQRLKRKDYPEDLSPYFYYLLIGDSYLGLSEPERAKAAYVTALEHDTAADLVSGKLRGLAQFYEERKEFEKAIEILREYRHLDPADVDIDIDRIHKELIQAEDEKRTNS